jgi:1,4-alpha-glucan branching enzyme
MLKIIAEQKVLSGGYGYRLAADDWHKILVFEKAGLLFILNFHPDMSAPHYETVLPGRAIYRIILNSDDARFGGHNRVNDAITYPSRFDEASGTDRLKIYVPNRTALILKRI